MRAPVVHPAAFQTSRPTGRWPGALLGLFVAWQLAFILAANLFEFYPHRVHRIDELTSYRELLAGTENPNPVVHALASVTDCWGQLTGQYQMWWLFAPDFPPQATFPVVELRWRDPALKPVRLQSVLEPADTAAYFHAPGTADRLLHYEVNLGLGYAYCTEDEAAKDPANWRRLHRDMVQSQWKSMRAYMRWRMNDYLAAHPEAPTPDEVRLLIRTYPTPLAGPPRGSRGQAVDHPFARWRPARTCPPDQLPVEGFDVVSGQFVSLPWPADQLPAFPIAHAHE
jgi:hypothetical protein